MRKQDKLSVVRAFSKEYRRGRKRDKTLLLTRLVRTTRYSRTTRLSAGLLVISDWILTDEEKIPEIKSQKTAFGDYPFGEKTGEKVVLV